MTNQTLYLYAAFGPKPGQKNVLIYATDLATAKKAALLLFKPSEKDLGLVHVRLVDTAAAAAYVD